MTDTIETTENVFEAKAREIVKKQYGLFGFNLVLAPAKERAAIKVVAAALEAERLEERERCKVFNADVIAMILAENPDASPAYLAVQICERIENA
jgi:hypothetical protein